MTLPSPLAAGAQAGGDELFVKQVMIEDKRYIVCRNDAEAEKDRNDREGIVAALDGQLKKGDKALIGTPPTDVIYARALGPRGDERQAQRRPGV